MYVQMNHAANRKAMHQVPGKNEQKYVIRNPKFMLHYFYTQHILLFSLKRATNNSQIAGTNQKPLIRGHFLHSQATFPGTQILLPNFVHIYSLLLIVKVGRGGEGRLT